MVKRRMYGHPPVTREEHLKKDIKTFRYYISLEKEKLKTQKQTSKEKIKKFKRSIARRTRELKKIKEEK